MSEDIELNKLRILANAMETAEAEEDAPDFVEELKECAFTVVRENPGIDRSEWIDELIRQYPTEVVDAYGTNPPEVYHDLSDLWEMEYADPRTGEWMSYAEWAEYFATERSVESYDNLAEASRETSRFDACKPSGQW